MVTTCTPSILLSSPDPLSRSNTEPTLINCQESGRKPTEAS